MDEMKRFLSEAAHVAPSPRQLKWFDREFYAFVHFSPNTYTGLEWGMGNEPESIFNPTELDCDQWVEAIKSAGMKGMILTAKHHDGFCLWPSKYTEHSVKNCPLDIDVVKEASDACRRGGIEFGFYLSPWDRNSALYGTEEYNDYYKKQLTELLTGYGDIFCVWLDGACGEGPNGRKQVYDFPGIIELIRKYQPGAVIFQDGGPDTRWIGNEAGTSRQSEWAIVPWELGKLIDRPQTGPGPWYVEGVDQLDYVYNTNEDIGNADQIARSRGLCFCGAEVDMSIRPGWFYHPNEEPHSLERLMKTYLNSVGHNGCFNLNIPPMPNGKFDPRDVERLREFGEALRSAFGTDLAKGLTPVRTDRPAGNQCEFVLELGQKREINYIELREQIALGQRVAEHRILVRDDYGLWRDVISGTTIGHKQIHATSFHGHKLKTDAVKLLITSARDRVEDIGISVY
ncbi:MAG: alpha-L-fucosidase [Candidatus Fimadaptatus sp.]